MRVAIVLILLSLAQSAAILHLPGLSLGDFLVGMLFDVLFRFSFGCFGLHAKEELVELDEVAVGWGLKSEADNKV